MELDEHKARIILDLTHAAWSRGDVEGVLAQYVDDLTWFCNTGGPDGGPLTVVGKQGLRDMLQPIADVAESVSVSEYFRLPTASAAPKSSATSATRRRDT